MSDDLPALQAGMLPQIDIEALKSDNDPGHKPRILLLYGSLRSGSYSRKACHEAARILQYLGCETRLFDPTDLPLVDGAPPITPRSLSCAIWPSGPKAWSGPAPNATAR